MASGHVNRINRPNTWLHRPTLQREDSPCQPGAVHTWPICDIPSRSAEVCFLVRTGPHLLTLSFSEFHPKGPSGAAATPWPTVAIVLTLGRGIAPSCAVA
jgi:hypothetical protein